jgi:hypothetical protein
MIEGWNWYTGDPQVATIAADQYDYETVVMHELGHAVGLQYEDGKVYGSLNGDGLSVMSGYLNQGQTRRAFSTHDLAWLDHLYEYGAYPAGTGTELVTADAMRAGERPPVPGSEPSSTATTIVSAGAGALPAVANGSQQVVQQALPPAGTLPRVLSPVIVVSPPLVAALPRSGTELSSPLVTVPSPPSEMRTIVSTPVILLQAQTPGLFPDGRVESSGGDAAIPAPQDNGVPGEAPMADEASAAAKEASQPSAGLVRHGLDLHATLWSEASSAYFALLDAAQSSHERPAPAPVGDRSEGNSGLALMALWGMVGLHWSLPKEEPETRRRWLEKR